jgi:hypothetical protein
MAILRTQHCFKGIFYFLKDLLPIAIFKKYICLLEYFFCADYLNAIYLMNVKSQYFSSIYFGENIFYHSIDPRLKNAMSLHPKLVASQLSVDAVIKGKQRHCLFSLESYNAFQCHFLDV